MVKNTDLNFFKDKRVTVFGLGIHGGGVGVARFLARHGARVLVTDIKNKEKLATSLEKLKGLKNVEYVLGQHREEDFLKADLIIKTPSISWNNKYLRVALNKRIPVETDASLFFRFCRNPIIGITGTKGKTTTSSLIYDIFQGAGKKPIKVGIGQVSVLDKLDELKEKSLVVFELSSWRLSSLKKNKISPHIAVITNIFPDHLNYYGAMEKYIEDKKNIFIFQKPSDWLIVNYDNKYTREINEESVGRVIFFSLNSLKKSPSVFVEKGDIFVNDGVDIKKVMSVEELKVKGKFNVANVLAAVAVAWSMKISLADIRKAVTEFKGVPHRLEEVAEIEKVKYYNDTAATIPEATLAALDCFHNPIVLIIGGTDKNLDFFELAKVIFQKTKAVVFLKGSATDKLLAQIKKIFPEKTEDLKVVNSLEEALNTAVTLTEPGDVVLFSPAAASFELFNDEFDRGDKFKKAVAELARKNLKNP